MGTGGVGRRRALGGAIVATGTLGVMLALATSASAAGFSAHGSAEQVYVTGLAPSARMSLFDRAGHRVATKRADSLGGLLFRSVKPGKGYRVRLSKTGAKSGPITTARFGEGSGPDARNWAAQAFAASVSSCQTRVRKPADSIASRVAGAVSRKLVAGVRAHGMG